MASLITVLSVAEAADPTVTTDDGTLRGSLEGSVRTFRGVPFAKAPVGDLRWRPPVRPEPWAGVRDATARAPDALTQCLQFPEGKEGQEDCLFLSVFAPVVDASAPPLAVMFWVHGGGYETGSGIFFNGTTLASSGVIVVATNYRLGPLGFLGSQALRTRDTRAGADGRPLGSTGNYGMQVCYEG
jgi:para-nitrobenzyl esterase